MSDFYKIQLRQYSNDTGYSGGKRPLNDSERVDNDEGVDTSDITGEVFVPSDYALRTVIFEVSPTVSESRAANYVDRAIPGPAGIIVYAKTENRRFTISARLVSRTLEEAKINYRNSNLLRSWLIPHSSRDDGKGGRPPIIRLNGYKQQFYNIPVVLTELSINFPEDVDYIEVPDVAMVPIIQTVEISLTESHRISAFLSSTVSDAVTTESSSVAASFRSEFNLSAFKEGRLPGY